MSASRGANPEINLTARHAACEVALRFSCDLGAMMKLLEVIRDLETLDEESTIYAAEPADPVGTGNVTLVAQG
jgi:hypothetical protein